MSALEFYQEIELLEQPDISLSSVWPKVYTQLHLALADFKNRFGTQPIGVSFPDYGSECFPLGNRLRLFASSEKILADLNITLWFKRLIDYVNVKAIHPVPIRKVKSYAIFSRKTVKINPECIARRYSKRHPDVTYEEALKNIQSKKIQFLNLPYLSLGSLSSQQHFKLFIDKKEISERTETLNFSTYGLSHQSSVPIF